MKLTTIALFLIQCMTGLLLVVWHLLMLFIELIDGGEDNDCQEGIGNHMTVGDNPMGDNSDIIKRAGDQYVTDRTTPLYERTFRH